MLKACGRITRVGASIPEPTTTAIRMNVLTRRGTASSKARRAGIQVLHRLLRAHGQALRALIHGTGEDNMTIPKDPTVRMSERSREAKVALALHAARVQDAGARRRNSQADHMQSCDKPDSAGGLTFAGVWSESVSALIFYFDEATCTVPCRFSCLSEANLRLSAFSLVSQKFVLL